MLLHCKNLISASDFPDEPVFKPDHLFLRYQLEFLPITLRRNAMLIFGSVDTWHS